MLGEFWYAPWLRIEVTDAWKAYVHQFPNEQSAGHTQQTFESKRDADLVWKLTWCRPFYDLYTCVERARFTWCLHQGWVVIVAWQPPTVRFAKKLKDLMAGVLCTILGLIFLIFFPCRCIRDFTSFSMLPFPRNKNSIETPFQGKENQTSWTIDVGSDAILCQLLSPKHLTIFHP